MIRFLSGADIAVDYQPNDGGPWLTRSNAELQAGSGSIGVLGAFFMVIFSAMDDADLVDLGGMGVASASASFNDLAKAGYWRYAVHSMDASKLYHGGQQRGAALPARGRRH